ncbi:MAG: DUF4912 domain-containing protein [Candidatus Binatia bacterium]
METVRSREWGVTSVLLGCAGWLGQLLGQLGAQVARFAGSTADDPRLAVSPRDGAPSRAADETGAAQTQVEEAKFFLGPRPVPRPVIERETGTLPAAYGRDRLVALPRDPWTIFVYWELAPTTRVTALRRLEAEAEGAREVLRVYDGGDATASTDVELTPGAESAYVTVSRPGATFGVELGVRTVSGRFVPLLPAASVTTPRAAPAPDVTVRWVTLQPHGAPLPAVTAWNGARLDGPVADEPTAGEPRSSDVHAPR